MLTLPGARLARVRALYALKRQLPRATSALLLTNSFSSALEMRLAGLRPIGYGTDRRGWLLGPIVLRCRNGGGATCTRSSITTGLRAA